MNDKMNIALAELQDSLLEINSWVELIKNSERAAASAIEQAARSSQGIQDLIIRLQRDAENTQQALRSTSQQTHAAIEKQLDAYRELAGETSALVEYLKSVNFPARLDKIDSSVASINTGIVNLSDKLDRMKDQLIIKLDTDLQEIEQRLKASQQQVEQQFKIIQRKQNTWFGLLTLILIILLGMTIYLITK